MARVNRLTACCPTKCLFKLALLKPMVFWKHKTLIISMVMCRLTYYENQPCLYSSTILSSSISYKISDTIRNIRCFTENIKWLPLAVVIITTANGSHLTFFGGYLMFSKISKVFSDLNRLRMKLTEPLFSFISASETCKPVNRGFCSGQQTFNNILQNQTIHFR